MRREPLPLPPGELLGAAAGLVAESDPLEPGIGLVGRHAGERREGADLLASGEPFEKR